MRKFDITPDERKLSVQGLKDFAKRFNEAAKAIDKGDDDKAMTLVGSVLKDVQELGVEVESTA